MTDVLYKIASAIATEEGYWTLNSLPSRNHNPGDLRAAPYLPASEAPIVKGFVQFKTPASGIAGLYHQIALDVARGITLRKLIAKWAPPTENNTSAYLEHTVRRTGLNPDIPIQDYLEIEKLP